MPDVWATVTQLDPTVQRRLAEVLETRGAEPRQQALRTDFLDGLELVGGARVLDVGCGTGVLTRRLAALPSVTEVVGVDVAPSLLEQARELARDLPNVTFAEADARALPFVDGSFDAVVFDSTLSHVPGPEAALVEAYRALRPGGTVGVFDGDYATTTVALGDHDPLQRAVDAMVANSVTDRWLMRRIVGLVRASGFESIEARSLGYLDTADGEYMLTLVDRGVDLLQAQGQLGDDAAAALRADARRRVKDETFFGHIAYVGLTARRAR
jgi:ubiquinone/menaquinone biosynthesis C-methylase UbiE